MGAMQAQDRLMVNWALGLRLSGATLKDICLAMDLGQIIRTHVLRPTWHLAPARDLPWMIALTSPYIKSGMNSRLQQLSLDARTLSRSCEVIAKSLGEHTALSREQLMIILRQENIPTDENRSSHILMHAELEMLICSGPLIDGKPTYTLFEKRIPGPNRLSPEESLAELTKRYFRSHGPATLDDFSWWSGLSIKLARNGIEMNRNGMILATSGNREYWMYETNLLSQKSVHILPAFDEYLISYKDRRELLAAGLKKKVISSNGIFYPLILQDGIVIGSWSRKQKKNSLNIQVSLASIPSVKLRKEILEQFELYGRFCGQNIIVEF